MTLTDHAITDAIRHIFHYVYPSTELALFSEIIAACALDAQTVCWDIKFATVKPEYGDHTIYEVLCLLYQHIAQTLGEDAC